MAAFNESLLRAGGDANLVCGIDTPVLCVARLPPPLPERRRPHVSVYWVAAVLDGLCTPPP